MSNVVPEGVLVFFKSYAELQRNEARWKQNIGLFKKTIFYERSSTAETNKAIEEYKDMVKTSREGAIFCCVMGAKCAEGIDFKDCFGRLAVVTGTLLVCEYISKAYHLRHSLCEHDQPTCPQENEIS
jgi:Rad3-related DNA helicase